MLEESSRLSRVDASSTFKNSDRWVESGSCTKVVRSYPSVDTQLHLLVSWGIEHNLSRPGGFPAERSIDEYIDRPDGFPPGRGESGEMGAEMPYDHNQGLLQNPCLEFDTLWCPLLPLVQN